MKDIYEYIFTPSRPAISFMIQDSEKAGTLETINAIQQLFGRGGKNWIKDYFKDVEDGITKVCLAGAAQETNGRYENAARAAISFAIAEIEGTDLMKHGAENFLADVDAIINFNDKKTTTWKDVLKALNRARKIVREA